MTIVKEAFLMNKKGLYGIIAVIVVIVVIAAAAAVIFYKPSTSSTTTPPPTPISMSVSTSTSVAVTGQSITYYAFITGGNASKVVFNFGDGTTGIATYLSGNEYTVAHSYTYPGKYLITVNATVGNRYISNLNNIDEISISPSSISASLASEMTVPSIFTSKQIYTQNSNVTLLGSIMEPPTAINWTIGYYIWNFGDGKTYTGFAILNVSSGTFLPSNISHTYSIPGIYTVKLGVITFNASNYVAKNYTINGYNYSYYPLSELQSIVSSGNYNNNTHQETLIITSPGEIAQIQNTTVFSSNPNVITVAEMAPGGPITLDPATEYYTASYEIVQNNDIYITRYVTNEKYRVFMDLLMSPSSHGLAGCWSERVYVRLGVVVGTMSDD